MYILAYRNLGIFNENIANRILRDIVKAARPVRVQVIGEATARGEMLNTIEAVYAPKCSKRSGN